MQLTEFEFERLGPGDAQTMQASNPLRYFNSWPEVIRLGVMMYVRFPLSLRNVEDLLLGGELMSVMRVSGLVGCVVSETGAGRSTRCL